jgi:hypothetical protein
MQAKFRANRQEIGPAIYTIGFGCVIGGLLIASE